VSRALLATGLLTMALPLAGCATLGESEFACPGLPSRPLCLSTSALYQLTNDSAVPPAAVLPAPRAPEPAGQGDPLPHDATGDLP
jgi:hypothetical protein